MLYNIYIKNILYLCSVNNRDTDKSKTRFPKGGKHKRRKL